MGVKLELEIDAVVPPSTEGARDPLELYHVFPTVKYWMDFASEVCYNKVRHKASMQLLRAIKKAHKKEKVDTEAQLKAALMLQRVWRARGIWTQVLQYKRRACIGAQFTKYGRAGSPHLRLVYLTEDLTRICWCVPKDGKRPSKDSSIPITHITDVKLGRTTDVFKGQKSAQSGYYSPEAQAKIDEERSFSFLCGSARTLDLEANTKLQAEAFIKVIRFVLICKGRITEDCLPQFNKWSKSRDDAHLGCLSLWRLAYLLSCV